MLTSLKSIQKQMLPSDFGTYTIGLHQALVDGSITPRQSMSFTSVSTTNFGAGAGGPSGRLAQGKFLCYAGHGWYARALLRTAPGKILGLAQLGPAGPRTGCQRVWGFWPLGYPQSKANPPMTVQATCCSRPWLGHLARAHTSVSGGLYAAYRCPAIWAHSAPHRSGAHTPGGPGRAHPFLGCCFGEQQGTCYDSIPDLKLPCSCCPVIKLLLLFLGLLQMPLGLPLSPFKLLLCR